MKRRVSLATALLLAACGQQAGNNAQQANASGGVAPAATATGFTMQPGEWETNIQTEVAAIANMPAGMRPPTIPPMTTRSCMTPEQARDANAAFLSGGGNRSGVECDYSGVTIAGGRIHGTSTCHRNGLEMSMTMDGAFTPTSFDIDQQVRTTIAGRAQETHSHMSGRRVGECPAGGGK